MARKVLVERSRDIGWYQPRNRVAPYSAISEAASGRPARANPKIVNFAAIDQRLEPARLEGCLEPRTHEAELPQTTRLTPT
jgi:hypothetical protein